MTTQPTINDQLTFHNTLIENLNLLSRLNKSYLRIVNKTRQNSISNLLIQICKQRRNKSNALLSDTGIHSGQDVMLYYLSIEDGQTVSSLVEKMCIQHATISNMIDRMEAAGMVKKEKDSVDKRTSRVFLTESGKEAFTKVAVIFKTMEAATVKGLTKEEQIVLKDLLLRVYKNLS